MHEKIVSSRLENGSYQGKKLDNNLLIVPDRETIWEESLDRGTVQGRGAGMAGSISTW